ncbi:nucleoside diphosphate kinase regulator [Chryseobacterium manosquense]|uniref:Nucleoside diphosphate kinase regulator n=1 Tax=Chryseobacterium manosquense TaxID=2754694 RepID=A0A7H1DYJ5_9FLAO|nr:nucleoside diphosphate kinase regulator [Chryseobacterium manosquense]QNS42053.1 nucleoside diphosphate kinase regulator [Chryseobacterium manosquense]
MKQILITKQDFTRIHKSISDAKQNNSIKKEDAEKLLNELHSAKIVESEEIPADVVTMNSVVKIHFENNKTVTEFKIVYPDQADIKAKKISIFSPVASALIGYSVKDEIDWLVPSGMTKIIIDEIIYQPEAAGDFDL